MHHTYVQYTCTYVCIICYIYYAYVTGVLCVQCQRLSSGLTKILEASEQLSVLNEKLEVQKVAVTEKSEACEILLTDITAKTTEANEKKELAEKKSVDIEEQNKVIAVEKVCTCKHETQTCIFPKMYALLQNQILEPLIVLVFTACVLGRSRGCSSRGPAGPGGSSACSGRLGQVRRN